MHKYFILGVLTLALSACSVPFMDSGKKSQPPPSYLGTTSPEQMKILKDPQKIATEKQNIRIQMVESLKKQGGDISKFGTGVLDLSTLTDQEFQSLYQTAFNPLDRDRRQKLVDFYKSQ
jgi:hypothetical protein